MEQKFSVINVLEFVCTLGVLRDCLFPKNFENAVPFVKCSMAKGHHIPKFPEKKRTYSEVIRKFDKMSVPFDFHPRMVPD